MRGQFGLGLLLGAGVLVSGCAPANFEGSIDDQSLGAMNTAFFDVYDDESGISYIFFGSYKWTCEEIQTANANGANPPTKDPDDIYTTAYFLPYKYSDSSPVDSTADVGEYTIVDSYVDALSLTEGSLYILGGMGYGNNSETTEAYYGAENGKVNIESVDLTKSISGSFSLSLSTADIISGEFTATRCDLPD